jgi:monoterpene epsilon-lactone hydrolase
MASIRSQLIRKLILPLTRRSFDFTNNTVSELRRRERGMPVPIGTEVEKTNIQNMRAEWVRALKTWKNNEKVILYLHGGGFTLGSCDSYRGFAARISRECGVPVLLPEYRLAPDHRFPAANNDCVTAYRWLLEQGFFSKNIIIGGDSAGGGLAFMTLLSLREMGDPLPAGAFLLSPWVELLQFDGESYQSRCKADPLISVEGLKKAASYYLNTWVKLPILTPFQQNLAGLPQMLIQVGDDEVLLSDSVRLADRVKESGGTAILEIWDNMWHSFQLFTPIVPESNQAIANIGKFCRRINGEQ